MSGERDAAVAMLVDAGATAQQADQLVDLLMGRLEANPAGIAGALAEFATLLAAGCPVDELLVMDPLDVMAIYMAMTMERWEDADVVTLARALIERGEMVETTMVLVNRTESLEAALRLWDVTAGRDVTSAAYLVSGGLSLDDLERLARQGVPFAALQERDLDRVLKVTDDALRHLALTWCAVSPGDGAKVVKRVEKFEGDAETAARLILDGMAPREALTAACLLGSSDGSSVRVARPGPTGRSGRSR